MGQCIGQVRGFGATNALAPVAQRAGLMRIKVAADWTMQSNRNTKETHMRLLNLSFLVIGAAIAAQPAHAQEFGDLQQGRALAQQVCAECHAVGAADARSPNAQAPRFEAVAATPGMTAAALNAFLHTSHRAMPNLVLTPDQTNGIITYILSLKK
jgi:mono/diheme cytochrome c family protein